MVEDKSWAAVSQKTKIMIKKMFFALFAALCFSIPALADEGSGFLRGDVDLDGNVNVADVTALIDYLLSGQWPAEAPEPEVFTVNDVSFTMIPVEGGTFMMGGTEEQESDREDEYPVHQVTLSSFSIGQTEVTCELWKAVMGDGYSYQNDLQRPMEMVTWTECQLFITKLNEMTGKQFRLPTEAEWEFAARGGNLSEGYKFAGSNDYNEVAWCANNLWWSSPVAQKAPNELGLYDMSGNVCEWCSDYYGAYSSEVQTDPTGPDSGGDRVIRGGNYIYPFNECRVARRMHEEGQWSHINGIGLRLAL